MVKKYFKLFNELKTTKYIIDKSLENQFVYIDEDINYYTNV